MVELREIPKKIHGIHGGFSEYPTVKSDPSWWKGYYSEPGRKDTLNAVSHTLQACWNLFYADADPNITPVDKLWWNINNATTRFKDWLSQDLRFDAYISGGSIAFFYNWQKSKSLKHLSDIDVYFQSKKSGELVAEHFSENPSYIRKGLKEGYPGTALTLDKQLGIFFTTDTLQTSVQLMVNPDWCNDPHKVISHFDFWHTFAYWTPHNDDHSRLQMHPYALAAMENRILLPTKNEVKKYRVAKMIENGWIFTDENFKGVKIVD